MSYDFQLESKLVAESPVLHKIFSDNVLCVQNMLNNYQTIFPTFTDHTILHSLEIIAFCNELVGDNIFKLNTDEIFILLMVAYLHDSGMGISRRDYNQFVPEMPDVKKYIENHPETMIEDVIRIFHHEFSGKYIRKYAVLFDFPSEEYLWSIIQVSRGHRKVDLFDESEYPHELKLPNGNVIHLPYLATLIRIADELDIASDRNFDFLYNTTKLQKKKDIIEFKKHKAIKKIEFVKDAINIYVDYSDLDIKNELDELFVKLGATLAYCVNVVEKCSPFSINQNKINIIKL